MTLPADAGPTDWMRDAACKDEDPDIFFIERGEPAGPAKAICKGCPVRVDCLTYALENSIKHGIWGGLSERERRRIRRQLNQRRAS